MVRFKSALPFEDAMRIAAECADDFRAQRMRAKPWAKIPQVRYCLNSFSVQVGTERPVSRSLRTRKVLR
jgi:hypothetical protein